jgi:hypothetical protein
MGQYFVLVNIDKKEYIEALFPKLWEWCVNNETKLLAFLLRSSNESGGGDIHKEYKYAGRWAYDRLVLVGDYDKSGLYHKALKEYKNITEDVIKEYNDFVGGKEYEIDDKRNTEFDKVRVCADVLFI